MRRAGTALLAVNVALLIFNGFLIRDTRRLQEAWKRLTELYPPEDLRGYSVVHMPPSGVCPAGFAAAAGIFRKDGRSHTGCVRVGVQPFSGMTDRIDPGEELTIGVPIGPPPRTPR